MEPQERGSVAEGSEPVNCDYGGVVVVAFCTSAQDVDPSRVCPPSQPGCGAQLYPWVDVVEASCEEGSRVDRQLAKGEHRRFSNLRVTATRSSSELS